MSRLVVIPDLSSRLRLPPLAVALVAALASPTHVTLGQDVTGDPVTEEDWSQFFPAEVPVDVGGIKDARKPHLLPCVVALRSAGSEAPSKCGVIVAQGADSCVVATVGPVGEAPSVRFHDGTEWIPATLVDATSVETEVAFLQVPLASTPAESFLEHFFVAPRFTVFDGVPANLLAPELGEDGAPAWIWSKGTLTSEPADPLAFRAERPSVPVGAALLNTDLEFVGLVLPGAGDAERTALPYARLSSAAQRAGLELGLVGDPVHTTLVAGSRQRRIATLVVRTEQAERHLNRWFAIELRLQIADQFGGSIIGYHHGSHVELEYGRSGFRCLWPKNLGVDFDGLGPFEALDPDALPGFLVYRSRGPGILADLALPEGDDQLLGTMTLVAGVNPSWLRNYGGRGVAPYLSGVSGGLRAVQVDGSDPLFPMLVPAAEDPTAGQRLRLPGAMVATGCRLRAEVALTDVHDEVVQPVKKRRLEAFEWRLMGDGPEPLASWSAGDSARARIDVRIPPGTQGLRWTIVGRPVPLALVTLSEAVLSVEPD